LLATANQDYTVRIWDIRNPSTSVKILPAHMAPTRSVAFTNDGGFFVMAEAMDFIDIYNVNADFSETQTIDIFGEVVGFDLTSDNNRLLIGVQESLYGCLLEFDARTRFIEDYCF